LKIYNLIFNIDVEFKNLRMNSSAKAFFDCCSNHPAEAGSNSKPRRNWKV